MRLHCKIFETLEINEESYTDKKSCYIKIVLVLYITNVICTKLKLSHVSDDCAFSIWECLRSEEAANIYHFCYILHLNFIFYYIQVTFLICSLQCATRSKTQLTHYLKIEKYSMQFMNDTLIFYLLDQVGSKNHEDSEKYIWTQMSILFGFVYNLTYVTPLRAQINFQNCMLQ